MEIINIIVPVYNVEQYLSRCIDSILAQSYSEFKLILIDDGSSDNSPQICDRYAKIDGRIVVIHQENRGCSNARNAGIEYSLSDNDCSFITFIDSDDWIPKDYLKILTEVILEDNSQMSWGQITKEDFEKYYIPDNIQKFHRKYHKAEDAFCENFEYAAYCYGKLYNKSLFNDIRFPEGVRFEDERTTYKLIFSCKSISVLQYPIYFYQQNDAGFMKSEWTAEKKKSQLDSLREEYEFFYLNGYYKAFEIYFKLYTEYLFSDIANYYRKKEFKKCLSEQRKSLRGFIIRNHISIHNYKVAYIDAFLLTNSIATFVYFLVRQFGIKGVILKIISKIVKVKKK